MTSISRASAGRDRGIAGGDCLIIGAGLQKEDTMGNYIATISWERQPDEQFTDRKYSRAHLWRFDGGVEVPASSSPHAVPLPYSVEANVDPEEAYVAAISSCHMLSFLFEAAKRGLIVDRYEDEAVGTMERIAQGRYAVTR